MGRSNKWFGGAELSSSGAASAPHFTDVQRALRYLGFAGARPSVIVGGAQSAPCSDFSGAWAWWSGANSDQVARSCLQVELLSTRGLVVGARLWERHGPSHRAGMAVCQHVACPLFGQRVTVPNDRARCQGCGQALAAVVNLGSGLTQQPQVLRGDAPPGLSLDQGASDDMEIAATQAPTSAAVSPTQETTSGAAALDTGQNMHVDQEPSTGGMTGDASTMLSQPLQELHLAAPPGLDPVRATQPEARRVHSPPVPRDPQLPDGTSAPLPQMPSSLDTAGWIEFTEETIAANSEFLAATVTSRGPQLVDMSQITAVYHNWDALSHYMHQVGYDADAPDPWKRLGVPCEEGPAPTIEAIEDRARRAHLLLSQVQRSTTWSDTDVAAASQAADRCAAARIECLRALPSVAVKRRKGATFAAPRFQEPPSNLEEWLFVQLRQTGRQWSSALWLSNCQGSDLPGTDGRLTPTDARALQEQLCKGTERAVAALAHLGDGGLVIWSPQENTHIQRLLAALQRLVTENRLHAEIVVVCPREPFPDFGGPAMLSDVWSHPLLSRKWEGFVTDTIHLIEPALMVSTIGDAASTVERAFSVFRLGIRQSAWMPREASWSPSLLRARAGYVICVDCLVSDSLQVQCGLAGLRINGIIRWEGPLRSLGSTPTRQRVRFQGYVDKATTSPPGTSDAA